MGAVSSCIFLISGLIKEIAGTMKLYDELVERVKLSPGLPVPKPTKSFWMYPPSKIASTASPLPSTAEVVIIGSGVTGASVARTLLQEAAKSGDDSLKVVMLEARQTCSGATGRNGGHVNPALFHDYPYLKAEYGIEEAQKIIIFRLSHYVQIRRAAEEEGLLEMSQVRAVESLDVFYTEKVFEEMKQNLKLWKEEMPAVSGDHSSFEREAAFKRFRIATDNVGAISGKAGAVHPYRFVTGILESLLAKCPRMFELHTETPCTSISPPSSSSPFYMIKTPRGAIQTKHIVHATNGWVSHHVPGFRGKIIPMRGTMTAQRPGTELSPSTLDGGRAITFVDGDLAFDYLTQLPVGEKELMFGGGAAIMMRPGLTEGERSNLIRRIGRTGKGGDGPAMTGGAYPDLGTARDDLVTRETTTHLAGTLGLRFGLENWGSDSPPQTNPGHSEVGDGAEPEWFKGRVKAIWTGVLGMSTDSLPWVGRLSDKMTGRRSTWKGGDACSSRGEGYLSSEATLVGISEPKHTSEAKSIPGQSHSLATAPGEWIAAGYTGEGMTHAWMSGRALAYMILGKEKEGGLDEWFPKPFRVSEKRWEAATFEKWAGEHGG